MAENNNPEKRNKEDLAARIVSARPIKLIIINYELLISSIDDAISGELTENAEKAREFLTELQLSLDMSIDVSKDLLPIYIYVGKIINEAIRTKNAKDLPEAKKILAALLDTWRELESSGAGDAIVFDNPFNGESPYITYGKHGEIETYDDDPNKGFTV